MHRSVLAHNKFTINGTIAFYKKWSLYNNLLINLHEGSIFPLPQNFAWNMAGKHPPSNKPSVYPRDGGFLPLSRILRERKHGSTHASRVVTVEDYLNLFITLEVWDYFWIFYSSLFSMLTKIFTLRWTCYKYPFCYW